MDIKQIPMISNHPCFVLFPGWADFYLVVQPDNMVDLEITTKKVIHFFLQIT